MTETPEGAAALELPTDHHLRSIEAVRTCATVVAALLLMGTVVLPFMATEGEDFSWSPLVGTLFWGSVLTALSWRRPRSLAAAGTVLVIVGVTLSIALSAIGRWARVDGPGGTEDPVLTFSNDAGTVMMQPVILGALLLGGALALTAVEVQRLSGRAAYTPGRLAGGLVAGALAGWLTTVLYMNPQLLEGGSLLFTVCVVLVTGTLVTACAAISPLALVLVMVGFVVLVHPGDWSEELYQVEDLGFQRHRMQLMIVVLASTLSLVPFREDAESSTSQ